MNIKEDEQDFTLNYHLMHPGRDSDPGDPNAAFYLDGTFHLHYILRHPWKDGLRKRSFSFIHVTSPDMLHWTWQETRLQPSFTGHGMFSGTGFISPEGKPAIIYHGEGTKRNHIAVAKDMKLSSWEKPYPVEVTIAEGCEGSFPTHWDPDCFQIGDTWYAISGGTEQPIFKSKDLKNWTHIGDFLKEEMPDVMIGEDISCPNFFPLGDKWMLLCISHSLGCRYYIGEWDEQAEQFVPEVHDRMNWQREDQPIYGCVRRTDFFAPESLLTPDGRRVMWGWFTSLGPDQLLLKKTILSLPRQLSLSEDGGLLIEPLRELESLRFEPHSIRDIAIEKPITNNGPNVPPKEESFLFKIAELKGDAFEIRIVISRQEAYRKLIGFMLFGTSPGDGLPILLRPETGTLRVGNTEAPFSAADLSEEVDVELRIFIDKYVVEVFANNRQAVAAAYMDHVSEYNLEAFCVGKSTMIKRVDIWKMKATNQGYLEAKANPVWKPDEQ